MSAVLKIDEATLALRMAKLHLTEMTEAARRGLSVAAVERYAEYVDDKIDQALAALGE